MKKWNTQAKQEERSYRLAEIISRTILQKIELKITLNTNLYMSTWDYYTQWSAISLFSASLTPIYIFLENQEDEKLNQIQALHSYDLFDVSESLDLVIKM